MKRDILFIRTDKAIVNALIKLLKDKPFEKITVQDILDETPVSRGTFYAHFKDKYEIAERMQEEFFALEKQVIEELTQEKYANYHKLIHRALIRNRELVEALLKIRTDKVDLRNAISKGFEEQYLAISNSKTKETEAQVYAQAMTVIQLSYLQENNAQCLEFGYIENVMIEVLLHMLCIDNQEAVREFLWKHLRK